MLRDARGTVEMADRSKKAAAGSCQPVAHADNWPEAAAQITEDVICHKKPEPFVISFRRFVTPVLFWTYRGCAHGRLIFRLKRVTCCLAKSQFDYRIKSLPPLLQVLRPTMLTPHLDMSAHTDPNNLPF